jgi:lipoprotein-anchoring transpeptidase ErfK/SrfK
MDRLRGWTSTGERGPALLCALMACVAALVVGLWLPLPARRARAAPPPPAPAAATVTIPAPPPPVPAVTTIATVTGPVPFAARPGGRYVGAIPVGSWWGTTKRLPVIDVAPGWLQVRLPQRPNGLTGWIPDTAAQLSQTTYGILIDVRTERLQLWRDGRVVLDLPAGVGTPTDPTPLGQFYVMDVAPPEGPGWGPFMLDTNAHSEAILSWEGTGDAFTAIHGPIDAWSDEQIGTHGAAISHGCVRLHDADLAKLAPVPAGAPVVITS